MAIEPQTLLNTFGLELPEVIASIDPNADNRYRGTLSMLRSLLEDRGDDTEIIQQGS